jgi:hypothetical protein
MLTFTYALESMGCAEDEAGSGSSSLKSLLRRSLEP